MIKCGFFPCTPSHVFNLLRKTNQASTFTPGDRRFKFEIEDLKKKKNKSINKFPIIPEATKQGFTKKPNDPLDQSLQFRQEGLKEKVFKTER